jgi:hypothetical protein
LSTNDFYGAIRPHCSNASKNEGSVEKAAAADSAWTWGVGRAAWAVRRLSSSPPQG